MKEDHFSKGNFVPWKNWIFKSIFGLFYEKHIKLNTVVSAMIH